MKMPPLNALRAFDAVARHGSVRLAAAELFVTPAAVSQQVRQLEQHLNLRLFERRGRRIELSDAGRSFHLDTSRHLLAIAAAAERARPAKHVRVTSVPSFAARWLVPRLPSFTSKHPGTEVRVDASPTLVDLPNSDFDLAFREGLGKYRGTESRRLFDLDVVPVAHPAYVKSMLGKRGGGWKDACLLHETIYTHWWQQWLEAAGIDGVDASRGLYFSHTMLTLAAAVQRQGIALAPRFMVQDDLDAGVLRVVDERELVTPAGYYVVWPSHANLSATASAFREWVIDEAARAHRAKRPRKVLA
jgi:LysR family glycine cleavage system transcriptional activator